MKKKTIKCNYEAKKYQNMRKKKQIKLSLNERKITWRCLMLSRGSFSIVAETFEKVENKQQESC